MNLAAIPYFVTFSLFLIVLYILIPFYSIWVLVKFKTYTHDDSSIDFTIIKKRQMLFSIISFVSLIVGLFSPAFRYGGNLGNFSLYKDGVSVFEVCEAYEEGYMLALCVLPLVVSHVFCIIGIRVSNRAFYCPLIMSIYYSICMIVFLGMQIASVGGSAVSAGIYRGFGFYALIVSAISGGCVFLALLFSDKKQPTEQSATVTR